MLPDRHFSQPTISALVLALLLVTTLGLWSVSAQEGEPESETTAEATEAPVETEIPPTEPSEASQQPPEEQQQPAPTATPLIVRIRDFSPRQVFVGQAEIITIEGENFTGQTTVRLIGFGDLQAAVRSPRQILASLPSSIPRGEYILEVRDPARGWNALPDPLVVRSRPAPDEPDPTDTPEPTAVQLSSLFVRNFSANPATIVAGSPVTLTFEVVNQGNNTARGISVTVDPGGKFVPANGQAGATLPDIGPGGVITVTLAVVSAKDTPPGPNAIPLTITYRDDQNEEKTSRASLSVNVNAVAEVSQVTLARYLISPNPVVPGEPVMMTMLLVNSGNQDARQVLLRISGDDSLLLAGPQGDTFPLGDLPAGATVSIDIPMIVRRDADPGPQSQPVSISHLQAGVETARESTGSLTLDVARVIEPKPVLLLEEYDIGVDILKPGDRFILEMLVSNVGDADAPNVLVTFGTVESSGGSSGGGNNGGSNDDNGDGNSGGSGGSSTSTTTSTTFAPLGAGGTLFIGTIDADGGEVTVRQEFIVNGTTESGIYSLPITLRYENEDGGTSQENLNASVVVVVPPLLQVNLESPLPDTSDVGVPVTVSVNIENSGRKTVNFARARVEADNADVPIGAEQPLAPLRTDDDTSISFDVMPQSAGPVTVALLLDYLDDLNTPRTVRQEYTFEAVVPPPPPDDIDFEPELPTPTPEPEQDMLGRLLLGLLGLGS